MTDSFQSNQRDTQTRQSPLVFQAGNDQPHHAGERRHAGAEGGDDANASEQPPQQWRKPWFWLLFIGLLIVNWSLATTLLSEDRGRVAVPYTFFKEQVQAGNVTEITSQGQAIRGSFAEAVQDPDPPEGEEPASVTRFSTRSPVFATDAEILDLLEVHDVPITVQETANQRSLLVSLLLSFGPALLLVGGFLWLSSRATQAAGGAAGGMFNLGRSRARRYDIAGERPDTTFDDVAGIDEVKHELVELVDYLKHPEKYQRLGGTLPKGVLLIGDPGTGKTLLARAVAGEAEVPYFSQSGAEFTEMVVGVGASRVRDLFSEAKKAAPAIIFIDELDAIGRRRGTSSMPGSNEEREQTLNQLLSEMDGFDPRQAVIVIAATNRGDVLDPALLRPGRFDRRIEVHHPDKAGRAAILKVHTRDKPLADDVDLDIIASETPGLVGAELRNLTNEAALFAARKGHDAVHHEDFADALEKVALGTERRLTLTPDQRRRIAVHESGHALIGLLVPGSDPVRRVTIVPRGRALGVTLALPEIDRYNYDEAYLRVRIINALGGRAAEQVCFDTVTNGAENDLQQVTNLARAMVTRWGMSEEVGLLALDNQNGQGGGEQMLGGGSRQYSEELARSSDHATRRIVEECYNEAVTLLTRERQRLEALSEALLRDETLDEQQMLDVTSFREQKNRQDRGDAAAAGRKNNSGKSG
jgi:cell division protease FtsH